MIRFTKLFAIFAGLAVFVVLMGMFGLTVYSVSQKTKEIGTRKIVGASLPGQLRLLTQDMTLMMLVAIIPALSLTYWAKAQWLGNYAFRIEISWWLLAFSLIILLPI